MSDIDDHGLGARSSDLQTALAVAGAGVPFNVELSLAPLISFWTQKMAAAGSAKASVSAIIAKELDQAPALHGAITDLTVFDKHRELLDVLMAAVFPPAMRDEELGAALLPFRLQGFYATPPCRRVLMDAAGRLRGRVNLDQASIGTVRLLLGYALILRRLYGIDLDLDYTLIFTASDPDTGLDRHFKMTFDWRFLDVEPVGSVPELPEAVRERLTAKIVDPEILPEILPVDRFVLRGFTVFKATEVTDQEVLSSLQRDLIDKESVVSPAHFQSLQAKLRTLFRRPDLRFGLAAIDGDQVLVLNYGVEIEHECIFADSAHHRTDDFAGSIYQEAVTAGRPLIVEDLAARPGRTMIEDQILASGVRNIVVAPLFYQERLIGTLELGSPNPGDLNGTHLPKLHAVLPLFSMAVQRSMDELNARVQAVIKEKATAIHPTVEWRFRQAVLDAIERQSDGAITGIGDMEPIVFGDVYPLYALADVRGSSTRRALAIQADLLAQLRLARDVVRAAYAARRLPALDELGYRVDRHMAQVETSLKSGDEVTLITFLRSEVEPLFDYLEGFGAGVRERIEAYRRALDPRLGTVYAERQRFEQSVTRLNEAISTYLDLEEQAAQAMVPHYFEKQKTDGVDYQIYAGASLLEDGAFDRLGLRNLRLWQLMVTCGIALRAHQIRDTLPMPLETTHLVLVQHASLAIRFRFDEKRFDVDGAYDIRYEIVKKRIDKALVRGTTERVTQPGQIAIIYSQRAEAQEYRGYLEYLQHLGYVGPEIEELELDELQGVYGLRALRVRVNLEHAPIDRIAATELRSLTY